MKTPTCLYKMIGGAIECVTVDASEVPERGADGWKDTPAAFDDQDTLGVAEDGSPVTRSELEAKATELGIKFDGRTSDAKLAKLISDNLGE